MKPESRKILVEAEKFLTFLCTDPTGFAVEAARTGSTPTAPELKEAIHDVLAEIEAQERKISRCYEIAARVDERISQLGIESDTLCCELNPNKEEEG